MFEKYQIYEQNAHRNASNKLGIRYLKQIEKIIICSIAVIPGRMTGSYQSLLKIRQSSFHRHTKNLIEIGLVEKQGRHFRPTYHLSDLGRDYMYKVRWYMRRKRIRR